MEIPSSLWSQAIARRHSRRQFNPSRPIPRELLSTLRRVCVEFRPFQTARVEVHEESPGLVFRGIVGSYGKVKSAPAYLVFIADIQDPHAQEAAGYCGEGIVLEAVALGLSTCWVAGFFRRSAVNEIVNIGPGEKVLAVSPLGYSRETKSLEEKLMSGAARSHRRKPLQGLVTGIEEVRWPAWLKPALAAARLAPSATNRQPWRFQIEPGAVTISFAGSINLGVSKRLDCGIAMLHFEVSALNQGIRGQWELLSSPQVARFRF